MVLTLCARARFGPVRQRVFGFGIPLGEFSSSPTATRRTELSGPALELLYLPCIGARMLFPRASAIASACAGILGQCDTSRHRRLLFLASQKPRRHSGTGYGVAAQLNPATSGPFRGSARLCPAVERVRGDPAKTARPPGAESLTAFICRVPEGTQRKLVVCRFRLRTVEANHRLRR